MVILMSESETIQQDIRSMAERAKEAAITLALLDPEKKNKALVRVAETIRVRKVDIIEANKLDVEQAKKEGQTKALIDRLTLNSDRVDNIADGLKEIATLSDPVGEILREWTRPNGLRIRQVRVPLGVIGMIYESRPNVTPESAALCLKSGNAVILRGGSDAYYSNRILVDLISHCLKESQIPEGAVQFLPPRDRRGITVLTQLNGLVDLIIARGSETMIQEVTADATVPVLGHGKGVCHVYLDKSADIEMAVNIAFNSKVQRPGVCNAMETLLVHEYLLYDVMPRLAEKFLKAGVEIRGDEKVAGLIPQAKSASPNDWSTEYLDKIVSIKVVNSLDEAIEHIRDYGSSHTDSIVTQDSKAADVFKKAVDSSCVMVNASTRLHDGGVFGFGSEIGISTNKLHARGTMGLKELTTTKFVVEGSGQIRE